VQQIWRGLVQRLSRILHHSEFGFNRAIEKEKLFNSLRSQRGQE